MEFPEVILNGGFDISIGNPPYVDVNCEEYKHVIFKTIKTRNLYSYIRTAKYEAFDELETEENYIDEKLYIGFDPQFLVDTFSIVDSENPVCIGTNAKAPMIITGNEYSFLVLPVNITKEDCSEKFKEHINRSKAA